MTTDLVKARVFTPKRTTFFVVAAWVIWPRLHEMLGWVGI